VFEYKCLFLQIKNKMKTKNIYILLLSLLLISCGEYSKLQKSTDNNLKFEKAKEYYDKKKWLQAASLFESVLHPFKGTEKGEEALYMLGMSYLNNKDYTTARSYFASYFRSYPRGQYAEESKFNVGFCLYKTSPNPKLDQTNTTRALDELFLFAELFPQSARLPEVLKMANEMEEKLAYKAYMNVNLYYKLGNYMGNNYRSAVIAATNAIKEFPESKYREELSFIILKSKFQQAEKSVQEKMADRYRDTVDEYHNFVNEFPNSKFTKEAQQMFEKSRKFLN